MKREISIKLYTTVLIICCITFPFQLFAQPTEISGIIDANEDWDNPDGYRITDNVIIDDGAIVSISAGIVIGFDGRFKITISNGRMDVNGAQNNKVCFTNSEHAAQLKPQGGWGNNNYDGSWCYLEFLNENTLEDANFKFAVFQNGGWFDNITDDANHLTGYLIVNGEDANLSITDCEFIGPGNLDVEFSYAGIIVLDLATFKGQKCFISETSYGVVSTYNRDIRISQGNSPLVVQISGFVFDRCGGEGIFINQNGTSDHLITQCYFDRCGRLGGINSGLAMLRPWSAPDPEENEFELKIYNCIVFGSFFNGFTLTTDPNIEEVIDVRNNLFIKCGHGPVIQGDGLYLMFGEDDDTWDARISNNIAWDSRIAGFNIGNLDVDRADHLEFYNNVSGSSPLMQNELQLFGARIFTIDDEEYSIEHNAFKRNQNLTNSVNIIVGNTCKVFENGDIFKFVNEQPNYQQMTWDFRLLIDYVDIRFPDPLFCALLSRGYHDPADPMDWRDPDRWRSYNDIGLFGGPEALFNINPQMQELEDYVYVTDPAFFRDIYLTYEGMDVFRIGFQNPRIYENEFWVVENGAEIQYVGTFYVDGTIDVENVVFTGCGISFSQTCNIDNSRLSYCEVSTSGIGINLNGLNSSMQNRLLIDNCTIDSCGVGIYSNNSNVAISNTTVTNSHNSSMYGAGIYLVNSTAGQVLIDNCTIESNGTGSDVLSAGIYLYQSDPEIVRSTITDNSGAGITAIASSPDLNTYDWVYSTPRHNHIFENGTGTQGGSSDGAEIFLGNLSSPTIKYNNIHDFDTSPNGWAVYMDDVTLTYLNATKNYWGTDSPDVYEYSLFRWYSGAYIDYSNWEDYPITDSFEDFEIAMRYWDLSEYSDAMTILERTVYDTGSVGINSIRYLTGCVNALEDGDLRDLRALFQDVATNHNDIRVSKTARRYATHCLTLMGNYNDALDEFDAFCQDAPSRADSIMAVMDYLAVWELVNGNEVNAMSGKTGTQLSELASMLHEVSQEDYAQMALPQEFVIASIYPNPFNNRTTIRYALPNDSEIKLAVFDISGRQVDALYDGFAKAGHYTVVWDGKNASSGVYMVQMQAGGHHLVHKVVLVK